MGRLSSNYGPRGGGFHGGTDYAAPIGTPIYANGPMTVTGVYPNGSPGQTGYGNTVTLRDANGVEYRHAHLDSTAGLKTGQQVGAGDLVGTVGNTGNSSGPHNHFEASPSGSVANKNSLVNPEGVDPKTGKPYADAFSMRDPASGSLNDARANKNGETPTPTPSPTDPPPAAPVTTTPASKVPRSGRRVHRLTDRNEAGGAIDQCVAKTVFVNNLQISVNGSMGTSDSSCPASPHCYHEWLTANGSTTVFAENIPVNFEGNADTCGHRRIEGSPDVFVGEITSETQDRALGADRPARVHKEPNKGGGNASPSNIACRQREIDKNEKENKPDDNDPNKDGPQKQADADDPNKPVDAKPGVQGEGQANSEQASRDRLRAQMDQDYANRDQWAGGKRSPAGNAAFQNLGYGNAANGTAWCAAYVNSNLKDSGAGYASSLAAASPKAYKPVGAGQAKPGDVLVFDGGRHTALVYDVKPNGDIVLQGGNQGGGDGQVTRSTITAASGYQYGSQRVSGIYNPHDQEYNRNNNLNVVPNGKENPGYSAGTPGAPNKNLPGKDCPSKTPQEQAADEGRGIKTDQDGVYPTGNTGREPDSAFPDPSSVLAGVITGGGAAGSAVGGITGGILGTIGQSPFGAGAGRGFVNPPLVNSQQGPYATPPKQDPIIIAYNKFVEKLAADPGPPVFEFSTCESARELAKAATGKQNPSGTEVAAQLPLAQKAWWDNMYAVNQHKEKLASASFAEAGVTSYRVTSAETLTKMMAYHSGWGNSKCNEKSAWALGNPLGIGWNGSTWYNYNTMPAGVVASWAFINFGKDGSMGRYMLPSSLSNTSDAELDYIYTQGFTNGKVPPAVKLIKAPE